MCSKCKIEKPKIDFHFCKKEKSGLKSACKVCRNSINRAYKKVNKELIREQGKTYRLKNKTSIAAKASNYHLNNRDTINAKHRSRYRANPEITKIYCLKHKAILNQKRRLRRQTNELFGISAKIRNLIGLSFRNKGFKKASKTATILGCSFEELQNHLRLSFETNYGLPFAHIDTKLLHIDHIIPLATAKTEEDIVELNHYSNLQYLFSWDNLEKSDKLDWKVA